MFAFVLPQCCWSRHSAVTSLCASKKTPSCEWTVCSTPRNQGLKATLSYGLPDRNNCSSTPMFPARRWTISSKGKVWSRSWTLATEWPWKASQRIFPKTSPSSAQSIKNVPSLIWRKVGGWNWSEEALRMGKVFLNGFHSVFSEQIEQCSAVSVFLQSCSSSIVYLMLFHQLLS